MLPTTELDSIAQPATPHEVGELVRAAIAGAHALFPLGGQTMLDVGLPPDRRGIGVDLRSLNQVIDFPARDMTVTVQAGLTIRQLQQRLAAENLRLPIDVPRPEQATLGGSIAVNVSGPRRFGFGTLRDYVIGISFVNDEGHEVKAGGRVVKNVAGYDLCKLQVGALGTLGILTQVTLKLRPVPEESALITVGCASECLPGLLDQLHDTRTRPVAVDVLNRHAAEALSEQRPPLPSSDFVVVVGFEDNSEAVHWQVQELVKEMSAAEHQGVDVRMCAASEPLWKALCEHRLFDASQLSFKVNLTPKATGHFCRIIESEHERVRIQAQAGNGIITGHVVNEITKERAKAILTALQCEVAFAAGNVVVLSCPSEWKNDLPIWGMPRGDVWLMRAVKNKLDPRRLFNPGRFVDGI